MSAEHRRPVMAFVVLAILAVSVVVTQRADAGVGRYLATDIGAVTQLVRGTVPHPETAPQPPVEPAAVLVDGVRSTETSEVPAADRPVGPAAPAFPAAPSAEREQESDTPRARGTALRPAPGKARAAAVVEPAKPHATPSRAYVARATEQAHGARADRSTRSHQPSRGSSEAMAPREVASVVLAARGTSLPAAARSGRPGHPAHPHAR